MPAFIISAGFRLFHAMPHFRHTSPKRRSISGLTLARFRRRSTPSQHDTAGHFVSALMIIIITSFSPHARHQGIEAGGHDTTAASLPLSKPCVSFARSMAPPLRHYIGAQARNASCLSHHSKNTFSYSLVDTAALKSYGTGASTYKISTPVIYA